MSDYSNPLVLTLVFGQGSSGKTTFCFRYLLNAPGVACRFIFDDRGQAADRLKLKPANNLEQCEAAIASRWVCFNPIPMFGSKLPEALRWFCQWSFAVSRRGPGRKILYVDELWQWVDAHTLPDELADVVRTGRTEGLELLTATHSPRDYHRDIRRMVTEWVCFNCVEPADLDAVRPYFAGVDRCSSLPLGHFLAYSREHGTELAGQVF